MGSMLSTRPPLSYRTCQHEAYEADIGTYIYCTAIARQNPLDEEDFFILETTSPNAAPCVIADINRNLKIPNAQNSMLRESHHAFAKKPVG